MRAFFCLDKNIESMLDVFFEWFIVESSKRATPYWLH
jgi:hypothetical protein